MAFSLKQFLGQQQVSNGVNIQPNLAEVGPHSTALGDVTPGFPDTGDNDYILTTAQVGALDPDAFNQTINWGAPPAPTQVLAGGAPAIFENNAPQQ